MIINNLKCLMTFNDKTLNRKKKPSTKFSTL